MHIIDRFRLTGLITLLAVGATLWFQFAPISLAGLAPGDIVTRFLSLAFIALVIERAVEIYIKSRFLHADATARLAGTRRHRHAQKTKRRAASIASLLLSLAVAVAGLRVLAQFLPNSGDPVFEKTALQAMVFHAIDVVLTSLLLSGGADGIHQLLKNFLRDKDELPRRNCKTRRNPVTRAHGKTYEITRHEVTWHVLGCRFVARQQIPWPIVDQRIPQAARSDD